MIINFKAMEFKTTNCSAVDPRLWCQLFPGQCGNPSKTSQPTGGKNDAHPSPSLCFVPKSRDGTFGFEKTGERYTRFLCRESPMLMSYKPSSKMGNGNSPAMAWKTDNTSKSSDFVF
jgi:hypothetical protein